MKEQKMQGQMQMVAQIEELELAAKELELTKMAALEKESQF